jgi:rhamnulokinase
MTRKRCYAAVDLGAESGRVVVGSYDGSRLEQEEIHRFSNGGTNILGSIYWDPVRLFGEIKTGLAMAAARFGDALCSVGVDTWGVDYALLDRAGHLISTPHCYRDLRVDRNMAACTERLPMNELYAGTGIQIMFLNTVFQLFAETQETPHRLEIADKLLFMPDLINYWLSGVTANEFTIASTSGCMDMRNGQWNDEILARLGIPNIFLEPTAPGTTLGALTEGVAAEIQSKLNVVTVGSHDTASAVAGVPAAGDNYAYVSSGTWALLGIESPTPIINAQSQTYNLTNEGGICDTIRVLANITGMWIVQECRSTFAAEGDSYDYGEITRMAEGARPHVAVIDPDYPAFSSPGNMPGKIQDYCRDTGQRVPETRGEILRTAFEGMALKYRLVLERLEDLRGGPVDALHVVGGGCQNALLNQMVADAISRPVITGPVEATAAGNFLMQMIAAGDLNSLDEGRELVRNSCETAEFEPGDSSPWEAPFEVLKKNLDH